MLRCDPTDVSGCTQPGTEWLSDRSVPSAPVVRNGWNGWPIGAEIGILGPIR